MQTSDPPERSLSLAIQRRTMDGAEIRLLASENAIEFPFSSESPVERGWGREVLDHSSPDAMRSERLRSGAVPLLWNHDWDSVIGMVESARVDTAKRRGYARARFFDTQRARDVRAMVDGGLRNVSFGYRVIDAVERADDYLVTAFEPYEISLVSVPADATVGIGRSTPEQQENAVRVIRAQQQESVSGGSPVGSSPGIGVKGKESIVTTVVEAPACQSADTNPATTARASEAHPGKSAVQIETERKQAIVNLCRANRLDDRFEHGWINSGASLNTVADELVKVMEERSKHQPATSLIDMSAKEVRKYSILRALRASQTKEWTHAGLELEAHKVIMERTGRMPRNSASFFVPLDVQQRDMTVAGVNGSNYLVSTDNATGSFIELLRNRSVALALGATRLSGLVGNVTIPKQSAASTAYWLADESTQVTESNGTFVQVSLTAKNVAALTEVSHQLLSQSAPAVETLVLSDLAKVVALAVDVAILRGSGSNGQPQGIVGTSGVGAVTATSVDYAKVLEFQSDVAANNALAAGSAYVTTPAVAAILAAKQRFSSTDTPLWEGNLLDGRVIGFRGMSSQQMASGTMLFGDFSQVILGEWGVLELMVNPYSDFTRGLTGIRAWYTCDVAVRHPGAFSYASSVTA